MSHAPLLAPPPSLSAERGDEERRGDADDRRRLATVVETTIGSGGPGVGALQAGVAALLRIELAELAAAAPADATVRLRRAVAIAAGLRAADHVQSPPIVGADCWDYQRDRHRSGHAWERQWVAEVLPRHRSGPEPRALLTSCGMAAVTTVLGLLQRHCRPGPVLVDAAAYHETRHLLVTGSLSARVLVVPSDELVAATARLRPAAVVVDAVANSADVRVADLDAIRSTLRSTHCSSAAPVGRTEAHADSPVLVIDTSVCSMASPHLRDALAAPDLRTVLIESLTKHAQHGLDRVPAGIIVTTGPDADHLDRLREHLGTNICDIAGLLLPSPDRALLDHRLDRVARNSELVAARLAEAGFAVSHPSRPDHPDHRRWTASRPSCGVVALGAGTLTGAPAAIAGAEVERPGLALVEAWLDEARRRHLPLVHGAGFGLDTTRVYATTASVPEATAFVRIAPGTEPIDEIDAVTDVLIAGAARVGRRDARPA